jgi:hypothetical protein
MPSIDCYWRQSKLYKNDIARSTMTRNRFQAILANWHFADNEQNESNDRCHKVNDLLKMLVTKFAAARKPQEDIVIDETMIPFRGRLQFKQYLPGKAHKYGVKIFKLCDSAGYTYNMAIYKGKSDRVLSLPTEVVMQLSQPYLHVGRTLVTDNYYTSIQLANNLLTAQTHLVGTLRSNRKGLPTTVTSARLKPGEMIARENKQGILVLKWKDKRDVIMLSTRHQNDMINTGKKNRLKDTIRKPSAIVYYNSIKQGIDVSDQLASYHTAVRKSVKWFHKVAFEFLMGTAVVNALLIFNKNCSDNGRSDKQLKIAEFRECRVEWFWNSDQRNTTASGSPVATTHYLQVWNTGCIRNKKLV